MHKSKFVLTYDRNGKLLSKHQFNTQVPSARTPLTMHTCKKSGEGGA